MPASKRLPIGLVNVSRTQAIEAASKRAYLDTLPIHQAFTATTGGETSYPYVPFTVTDDEGNTLTFVHDNGRARWEYDPYWGNGVDGETVRMMLSIATMRAIEDTLAKINALVEAWERTPTGVAVRRTYQTI